MGGIGLRAPFRFPLSLAPKGPNPASYDDEDGEDERTISVILSILCVPEPSLYQLCRK